VLYAGEDKTLRGVANFLSDPACPFEVTLHRMMTTQHLGDAPHPVVASAAREVLNKSDNERSGVLSTAMSFLGLYRDPTVAEVTSRCDWRIADLIDADHPVSLYLVVPPSDISRTKPLIRLILNQIGRRLTESLDGSDGIARAPQAAADARRVPGAGRLDFFESALAFMAGYGLRAFLIAQSLNQIDKAYGQNHSILDNCHVRIAFATNDERTAKRISETLGHGHRIARAAQLRGPPAGAVARAPDGVAPGNGTPAADARRGDAAAARRRSGDGVRPSTDQGPEDSLLPGREFQDARAAAAALAAWAYADVPAPRPDDWTGLAIPSLHRFRLVWPHTVRPATTAVPAAAGTGRSRVHAGTRTRGGRPGAAR
jgi:type IV secretion system protein VirD4